MTEQMDNPIREMKTKKEHSVAENKLVKMKT